MSTTTTEAQDADELRAELAETEHLCHTLDPRARAYVGRLLAETERLRLGLDLIAKGHLSPCMGYAQLVLDGEDPGAALSAEIARRGL